MTLAYWREYRTYFPIGKDWQLNESTVYRILHRVEDILMASGLFALPGKKVLVSAESEIETIVVDITEQEVERPKKTEKILQRQTEETYSKNADSSRLKYQDNSLYSTRQRETARL